MTSPFSQFFWVGPGDEANPCWGWLSLACETRLLSHCRRIKAAGLWVRAKLVFSFVPGPSWFSFFNFVFTIINGCRSVVKNGRASEHSSWWMQGGCGAPPTLHNILDHPFAVVLCHDWDSRRLCSRNYSSSKKPAFEL